MIPELIEKVFVINLKSCHDRKEHIKCEFQSKNITNYEFFEATDKDSVEVQELMKTTFVKKFPPCFRCNKNVCKCQNNVLINCQIGNWCSFINIMKHIIQNDYKGLIMVCEDDVKFTDNGIDILNKAITKKNLEKFNTCFEKPILIRLGSGFGPKHNLNHPPKLTKDTIMSNPCFLCNKNFSQSFIKNLKQINTTSDIYIHTNLPQLDKSIQAFTVLPQPIYELSCGKFKKFKSEIHPKGLNSEDIIRQQKHFQRIEYKDFLCIGHPRCGTTSISYYLKQMGYDVGHENMGKDGVSSWLLSVDDNNYPYGNIKEKFRYYFKNIIHVIRNPYDAIPSIILENKYTPNNSSYKFKKKHIKKILNIDLPEIDFDNVSLYTETELAIKTFIYWNQICELSHPTIVCKIEDITPLQVFNSKKNTIDLTKQNSNKKYVGKQYNKPIITNDMYDKIDDHLKEELINFCNKYEYHQPHFSENDNK